MKMRFMMIEGEGNAETVASILGAAFAAQGSDLHAVSILEPEPVLEASPIRLPAKGKDWKQRQRRPMKR